jgi:hypothetical protein
LNEIEVNTSLSNELPNIYYSTKTPPSVSLPLLLSVMPEIVPNILLTNQAAFATTTEHDGDNVAREDRSDKTTTTPRGSKKQTVDQRLHALLEEKLAEKKLKRQKHKEGKKRKNFENYDLSLSDYDQFIEFSDKFKKIKDNLGSGVQAAVLFPEFERLLSPEEKSELRDRRMV